MMVCLSIGHHVESMESTQWRMGIEWQHAVGMLVMAWLVAAAGGRLGSVAASDFAGCGHGMLAACMRYDTDVLGWAD